MTKFQTKTIKTKFKSENQMIKALYKANEAYLKQNLSTTFQNRFGGTYKAFKALIQSETTDKGIKLTKTKAKSIINKAVKSPTFSSKINSSNYRGNNFINLMKKFKIKSRSASGTFETYNPDNVIFDGSGNFKSQNFSLYKYRQGNGKHIYMVEYQSGGENMGALLEIVDESHYMKLKAYTTR